MNRASNLDARMAIGAAFLSAVDLPLDYFVFSASAGALLLARAVGRGR
ncbi:MAG: hypothetical protein JWO56_745 [Acidobacteria bacterium]|nr:hypothetical protein [Acidobacteriota bacterium]